jgi:hypothetical protein
MTKEQIAEHNEAMLAKKAAEAATAANNKPKEAKPMSDLAKRYPRVAKRCAQFGLELQAEYSMNETTILTGLNQQWVRKMVTGYRGKGKRAEQEIKARKVTVDGIEHWRISIEGIENKLAEREETAERREDRYNNPQTYMRKNNDPAAAIRKVQRLASEGLTPEEVALLKSLLEKVQK